MNTLTTNKCQRWYLTFAAMSMFNTTQLQGNTHMSSTPVLLASEPASMSWLLVSIHVKYMDIISTVLARHTTGNLIIMGHDYWGICEEGKNSIYMQICS